MSGLTNTQRRVSIATLVVASLAVAAAWTWARWSGDEDGGVGLPDELSVASLNAAADGDTDRLADTMRNLGQRDDLTAEQRRQAFRNMRQVWITRLDANVDAYFAAAEQDRQALLDQQIDDFMDRMKAREERRRQREQQRAARQGGDTDENDSSASDRSRRERWFASQTRQERKQRSESRNPDRMARRMAYFQAARARMTERGIQPPSRRGPGPVGGRGGGNTGRR